MSLGTYDTHDLIRVIQAKKTNESSYWLQFFPNVITFDQEYIDFDVVDSRKRLAPFVSPLVQGKPQRAEGFSTKRFKPAYIKPKDIVDPTRFIKRRAGEPYMGSMSRGQRRDAVVADILFEHRRMIERRWEWMAARAIIDGEVTISGEDYPTVVVSFERHADHTITLTGTDVWSHADSNPVGDLEDFASEVHQRTGYVVDRFTMGGDAYKAFKKHAKVKDLLDIRYRGSEANIDREPANGSPVRFGGRIGTFEIWVYADVYEADDGTVTQYMNQKYVVATASGGIEGVRCFGGIMDKRAGYQAIDMFPKMWEQEDPSVEYLMTQSAPLMVPLRANATLRAQVLA